MSCFRRCKPYPENSSGYQADDSKKSPLELLIGNPYFQNKTSLRNINGKSNRVPNDFLLSKQLGSTPFWNHHLLHLFGKLLLLGGWALRPDGYVVIGSTPFKKTMNIGHLEGSHHPILRGQNRSPWKNDPPSNWFLTMTHYFYCCFTAFGSQWLPQTHGGSFWKATYDRSDDPRSGPRSRTTSDLGMEPGWGFAQPNGVKHLSWGEL